MKFALACLAMLVLPQSTSAGGHSAIKVKLIGLMQETGSGALGKKALDFWKTWATDNGYAVELDIKPYVADTVQADIKGLIDAVPEGTNGVLIPPYTSGASKAFIEALPAGTTMPIMVWGGAADSLFSDTCDGKHCFGTFTVGSKYMTLGLEALLAKSSKPLTVGLIENNNGFSESVGSGAMRYISNTEGLKLVKHVKIQQKTNPLSAADKASVDSVAEMKPDVVAIAGHNGDVEWVIAEIKKTYVPQAILATNSITASAKANFEKMDADAGTKMMMCLLMPTQWGHSKEADPHTKWTSDDFKAAFKNASGGDVASYHAASAAAAGIAIADAIPKMVDTNHSLSDALKTVDIQSFYGPIKFNADGSIDKPMYVEQSHVTKSMVFTTMFGDLNFPLKTCGGWGKGNTCGDLSTFYKMKGCMCKDKKNMEVDFEELKKFDKDDDSTWEKDMAEKMKSEKTTAGEK